MIHVKNTYLSDRIKNVQRKFFVRDFSFNAFSYFVLGIFIAAGLILQLKAVPETGVRRLVYVSVGLLVFAGALTKLPSWKVTLQLVILLWLGVIALLDLSFYPIAAAGSLGLVFSSSFQLVYHWDKVVVLRMGKFRRIHGPGLFLLFPLIDRIADFVDTRIRVTDFSAEKTITKDTVPVHVDALAFWMIWDAKQAILEVENYMEAIVLSAQTALRDSIGKHDLATILSERDSLGKEIQQVLDQKTNPWGISILSIEFTDIIIPKELEDALSKRAQAERERQSRVILSTAEVEIAKKFEEAAESYKGNPTALQLRAMNMVYEGIRQKGAMMILPSSALDSMNLGTAMGAAALTKTEEAAKLPEKKQEEPHD
ncbi:MAG: slipin family protein [Spirochaetales bacterium]|nr:MAG: slipin family protein [Spirochaetales bacterium]